MSSSQQPDKEADQPAAAGGSSQQQVAQQSHIPVHQSAQQLPPRRHSSFVEAASSHDIRCTLPPRHRFPAPARPALPPEPAPQPVTATPKAKQFTIVEVWSDNVEKVFRELPHIVKKYPYIAMDTEFPGVVAKPMGSFISASEFHYQSLKVNVDLLQIIQLGITFFDEHGNTAPNKCTYQFNFTFDICTDMYASDSISLLQNCGIDFMRHGKDGINPVQFGELLTTSGLVMMDKVVFLSFHSGYDFGYLMKLLTNDTLPFDETGFFDILKIFFPNIYDVKYLMKSCKTLKGGLEEVAKQLELYFEDNIDELKYSGHLFGLGISALWAPIHAHGTQLYTAEQHQSNAVAASVAVHVHQQQMLAAVGLAMPPTAGQVAAADPFLSGQLITSAPAAPPPGAAPQPTYVPTVGHVTGLTGTEILPGVVCGNGVVTCHSIALSTTGGTIQPHLASIYTASASAFPPLPGGTQHSGGIQHSGGAQHSGGIQHSGVTFYPTPRSSYAKHKY